MSSRYIDETVNRRLYAESMGRCMNPKCRQELFFENGDIIERAHIVPYCDTANNSFENLVLLCPNCHTNFDKNHAFTPEEVLDWKRIRSEELQRFFGSKYRTFEELEEVVVPLLVENQTIFKNYYLTGRRELWDKFEGKILANNRMLKKALLANLALFQHSRVHEHSNLVCTRLFIAHIDEFEATRLDEEKSREILFPKEINSMFGIEPVEGVLLPSTESLEALIEKLKSEDKFESIVLGIPRPYIEVIESGEVVQVQLDDTPRIRQLYHDYSCFRNTGVRLKSLNFALEYIRKRGVRYSFLSDSYLREITIRGIKLVFIYEYCLSQAELMELCPEEGSVIVNLHDWNGESCISQQAYHLAESMSVTLLTMRAFYAYINKLRK